jgi:N-glycosidase YbiA
MTIYFYGSKEEPYGCFSNFSPHGFELDDTWWPTSEHYFQAQKFVGTPYAEEIRRARTASEAAKPRNVGAGLAPPWGGGR